MAVLGCATLPAGAWANDWGFANSSDTTGYDGYLSYYNSSPFTSLMNSASNGAAKYQRFNVFWEAAGTSNRSSCEAPTHVGSDLGNLINSMHRAEQAGQIPLITLLADHQNADTNNGALGYQWPADASLPANPTDLDMVCAVKSLLQDLNGWTVLPYTVPLEAYNGPDYAGIGNSCNGSVTHPADCAARYFADAVQGAVLSGTGKAHVIAGSFGSANGSSVAPGSAGCGSGGFDWNYICFLTFGDGKVHIARTTEPLSYFNQFATSWSFHDYEDVQNSYNCTSPGESACAWTDATAFEHLLSSWKEPANDVWMTEAGCRSPSGGLCANATPAQQANEALAWEWLRWSGVAHSFWFEWQYDSGWDSALLDQYGNAREDYCVLVSGYSRAGNCAPRAAPPAASPPPPRVETAPVTIPLPRPRAPHALRVKVVLTWTWSYGVTRLDRVRIGSFPGGMRLTLRCVGRGCPRVAMATAVGARRVRRMLRAWEGRRFRAGDRLMVTLAAPRYLPERAALLMRFANKPRVRLL